MSRSQGRLASKAFHSYFGSCRYRSKARSCTYLLEKLAIVTSAVSGLRAFFLFNIVGDPLKEID